MALFDKYAQSAFTQGRLRMILPTGQDLVYGNEDIGKASASPGKLRDPPGL